MALTEQREAVELAKNAGPETSNDQQTPPLLAKKPWWSMVVGSGGKSGLIGCRSAVREAREPRQIRAAVLILNSKVAAGKKRSVARVSAQGAAKQSHVRLTSVSIALWRARREPGGEVRASPARQNSKPSSGALLNIGSKS